MNAINTGAFDTIEAALAAARKLLADQAVTCDELHAVREGTELLSLYHFAKEAGVLVNNSAEDFAIKFYTAYNAQVGRAY